MGFRNRQSIMHNVLPFGGNLKSQTIDMNVINSVLVVKALIK